MQFIEHLCLRYTFLVLMLLILACSNAAENSAVLITTSPAQSTAVVPNGVIGLATQITVNARDDNGTLRSSGGDVVAISITGDNPQELTMENGITDVGDGSYTANYTPTQQGSDELVITIAGVAIQGSPFTSLVGAESLPLPPPNLTELTASNASITVNWSSVANAAGYYIYYSGSNNVDATSTRVNAGNVTQFDVTGLSNHQVFYFRVAAYDSNNVLGSLSTNTLSDFPYQPFVSNWANPRPTGHSFYDVQWLNNQYIAVGSQGTIYTSLDAITWAKQDSGLSGAGATLNSVAWSGSRYLVGGLNNSLSLSDDGSGNSWTPILDLPRELGGPGAYHFERIIWDGNRFVLSSGGQHRIFFIDEDGSNFQTFSTIKPGAAIFEDIVWDASNSRYLACSGSVFTSDDAITWTDFPDYPDRFPCVRLKNLNGGIVILGSDGVVSSASNPPWSAFTLPITGGLVDIAYTNGHYGAVTSSTLFLSTNLIDWSSFPIDSPTPRITSIGARPNPSDGGFAMVGNFGQMAKADASVTNPNLISTARLLGSSDFSAIASNGAIHVALGKDNIMYSPDNGISWSLVDNAGLDAAIISSTFNDVKWLNGRFIAVGTGGVIATSTNGQSWSLQQSGGSTLNGVAWNQSVANPQYVAVGVGDIYRSTDAVSWNPEASATTQTLNDVVWLGNQFWAVGYQRTYVSSTGNGTWTQGIISELGFDADILTIVDNGQTMIMRTRSPSGSYYSNDRGETWTKGTSFHGRIIWDGSLFVSPNGSNIFISPDGIHRNIVSLDAVTSPTDITLAGSKYYISGSFGHIVEISR